LRERGGPGVHGVWDWVSGRTHFTLSLLGVGRQIGAFE
jgi:hypothetical protein